MESQQNESIRINKFLSAAGVLSRRKADEEINAGRVFLNGNPASCGDRVGKQDRVIWNGRTFTLGDLKKKPVILAYYKPLGLVCTSAEADPASIFRKINYPEKLIYVGRLDKDSQGLLLLTTDGELANAVQKARNHHEKEYIVRVNRPVTEEFLRGLRRGGIPLGDRKTRKCTAQRQGENSFRIVITEGINRQIRRMCQAFDYRVVYLKRIRVMNIRLGDLKPGEYRELTGSEEKELRRLIRTGEAGLQKKTGLRLGE